MSRMLCREVSSGSHLGLADHRILTRLADPRIPCSHTFGDRIGTAVDHAVASGSPDPVGYVASLLSAEASKHSVDYSAVRRELLLMMDNPSWDDGSLAPIFIRLAWHSSGTYDAASGTGGSNGAGMRFEAEAADPENAGLHSARAFLEPVKRKFPGISYSDLWILAAYVGIEHTGGPRIAFRPGRVDYASEVELASYCCPQGGHGRLPAAEKYVSYDGVDAEGRPNGWQGLCMHIRNEVTPPLPPPATPPPVCCAAALTAPLPAPRALPSYPGRSSTGWDSTTARSSRCCVAAMSTAGATQRALVLQERGSRT